jgi:hypothetical protein
MIVELVVDEHRLVAERHGNAARADERRLADFFQGEDGKVKSDIRKLFARENALGRPPQIARIIEAGLDRRVDVCHSR